jgi:hypothetical protein
MPISRIKTDGIQDDAITSAKIGDTNIQSADIADGSVITAKIAAGAVTSAKLDTNIDVAGTLDVTSTTTLDSTLAVAGHGSVGNAGTVAGTRALTVVGATDGTSSSIIVGYNSSLASKFSVRDDGYVNVGNGLNLADGNLSVASGHGIDFSGNANASGMTSELLDDYEEGTWTPTVSTASSHIVQTGIYTKIGNLVTIQCVIQFVQSGSVFGSVSGLPFTVADVNYSGITFREWYSTGITLSGNLTIGSQSTTGFWNYVNSGTATNGQTYGYGFSISYRT